MSEAANPAAQRVDVVVRAEGAPPPPPAQTQIPLPAPGGANEDLSPKQLLKKMGVPKSERDRVLAEIEKSKGGTVERAPAGDGKGDARVRVGDDDTDFRQMSIEQFTARLGEESHRGQMRLLKALGIGKAERQGILDALDAAKGDKKGSPYRLAKAEILEALEKVKGEYEAAKPQIDGAKGYREKAEARLAKIADEQFGKLPKSAQAAISKRLPKDADAQSRLDAIEEAQAYLAELNDKGEGDDAEKKDGAGDKKDGGGKKEAAAAPATPPKPSNTGAAPGPTPPKTPGTLTPFEAWQDMKKRGAAATAGRFYLENEAAIKADPNFKGR